MSLADVISRFATYEADGAPEGYIITRTLQGARNSDGVYTPGVVTTFNIVACIQPYRGRGLKVLKEGRHATDLITIDTATELHTESATHRPDVIMYRDEPYTIVHIDGPMTLNGTSTYRAYASRGAVP